MALPENWPETFLSHLASVPDVTYAARAAGVSRAGVYKRRNADPDFAAAWDDAVDQATDKLVGACYHRATDGVARPVYYRGKKCGEAVEYADGLAQFLLRAHRPAVYGDKSKFEIGGPNGGPIPLLIQALKKVYGDGDTGDPQPGA